MRYLGDDEESAFALFERSSIVCRVIETADTIERVSSKEDEDRVRAWRVTKGKMSCVVKYSTLRRTLQAADQMFAESRASTFLSVHGPHPLLVLVVKTDLDPELGAFSISPYAGVSAAAMRTKLVNNIQQAEKAAKRLAACLLLTQELFQEAGQLMFLHRDIKLDNICYLQEHDLFVLIDYGLFSSVNKEIWVPGLDLRYIDRELAYYSPEAGTHAALDAEGTRQATLPSSDLYQTGLGVAEMFLGSLPAAIDYTLYNDDDAAYCDAVWHFDWSRCPEVAAMPEPMRKFLLKLLAANPDDRFTSVAAALQDPWLKDELPRVQDTITNMYPAWAHSIMELHQTVKGPRSRNSSSMEMSAVSRLSSCDGHGSSSSSGTSSPATPSLQSSTASLSTLSCTASYSAGSSTIAVAPAAASSTCVADDHSTRICSSTQTDESSVDESVVVQVMPELGKQLGRVDAQQHVAECKIQLPAAMELDASEAIAITVAAQPDPTCCPQHPEQQQHYCSEHCSGYDSSSMKVKVGCLGGSCCSKTFSWKVSKSVKRKFTSHLKSGCRLLAGVITCSQNRTHSL